MFQAAKSEKKMTIKPITLYPYNGTALSHKNQKLDTHNKMNPHLNDSSQRQRVVVSFESILLDSPWFCLQRRQQSENTQDSDCL